VLVDLPPLRDTPATPRTAIRIMRQSAMLLEQPLPARRRNQHARMPGAGQYQIQPAPKA
jgi:hypothetical protein